MKNTLTEMKNTLKGTNSGFDEAKRHKIFKMMKVKDLQPRLLYAERLSFRIKEREREKELPRQEEAEGVHHYQTSITRNVKGITKEEEEKNNKNINNKMAITTYLSIIT